ncbi:MAG: hypothetical protein HY803_02970 [candidate division NC10 bacterium]|nr:hypothetical protein [candidate division NC10 bacterium]
MAKSKKPARRVYPSGKGALIKGMSGRLPLQILDSPIFEDIIRIQRVKYLKDSETLLHRLTDAPGNRFKGKIPTDADLTRVLRIVSREQQRIMRGLAKALHPG